MAAAASGLSVDAESGAAPVHRKWSSCCKPKLFKSLPSDSLSNAGCNEVKAPGRNWLLRQITFHMVSALHLAYLPCWGKVSEYLDLGLALMAEYGQPIAPA